jgi:hypothetical protein
MSQIAKYGDYQFPSHRVTVREVMVYDSDDRTLLGTEYQISVSGWITANTPALLKAAIEDFRARASLPRRTFLLYDPSDEPNPVYRFDPAESDGAGRVDDWGPRPQDVTISEITGLRAARYSWQMGAFRRACGPNESLQGFILSVQRTYAFAVDVAGYVTRTVSGTLKVRAGGPSADSFRDKVTPGLPLRFKRVVAQFSQSPDERTLTFAITDQEEHRTLPTQIADGEATFGVKVADLGARIFYVLSGRFRGGPNTPKGVLLQKIADLVSSKFPINDPGFLFEEASIDESVYGNELAFNVVGSGVVGTVPGSGIPDFASVFGAVGREPPESNGFAFLTSPYGELPGPGHFAKVHRPAEPCGVVDETPVDGTGLVTATTDGGVQISDSGGASVPLDGVSEQHKKTPFVAFREKAEHHFDYGIAVADVKDQPGSFASGPHLVRTRGAKLVLTQSGYFTVYVKDLNDVPPVPQPVIEGRIMVATVTPSAPEQVAAGGWLRITVHWLYVVHSEFYFGTGLSPDANVHTPRDPRSPFDGLTPFVGDMPWLGIP